MKAVKYCKSEKCDYIFKLDPVTHINDKLTVKHLIEQDEDFIAPLLSRRGQHVTTNFWGSIGENGNTAIMRYWPKTK